VRPNRVPVLIAAAAAAAVVAGCSSSASTGGVSAVAASANGNGVESMAAPGIAAASKAAAQAAAAVHVKGTADGSDIDARLAGDVADVKLVHSGEHVEVLRVGTDQYLMGDAAFWADAAKAPAAAATELDGKWVKLTTDEAKAYEQFLSVSAFFDGMFQSSGTPTKGDDTTVDGVKVVTLVDTDGSKLYVATTGKPYPLKVANAGTSGDQISLTDWNVPITDITAPPAGSLVDPSTLTGG
jgi:hypothetical protein